MNLKEALATGKLKQFIKERLVDKPGDKEVFDKVIKSMIEKGKEEKKPKKKIDIDN